MGTVPGAGGEFVRVILRPQPQHLAIWGGQRVVHRTETHGDQGRVGGGFAGQVLAVPLHELAFALDQQTQSDAAFRFVVVPVTDFLAQGQAQDHAETVPHPDFSCGAGHVLGGQGLRGGQDVRAGHHRAGGVHLAVFQPDALRPPVLHQDVLHRRVHEHLPAVRLDGPPQGAGQAATAALGPRHAAFVVQRVPQQERGADRVTGRRATLRRHPAEGGTHPFLAEVFLCHVPVRSQDARQAAQRVRPFLAQGHFPQFQRAGGAQEQVGNALGKRRPVLQEARVRRALTGEQVLQFVCRAPGVAPDEPRRVPVRAVKQRVEFQVMQPVARQFQFLHHGRQANQDVGAAAVIEAVTGHQFLGADRPAHQVPPLEHAHAVTGPGGVGSRDQGVVARAHHQHVEVRH